EAIIAAFRPLPDEFVEGGFRWVWSEVAAKRFGISKSRLIHYHSDEAHSALGGQRLSRLTRTGSPDGSKVLKRVYYRADQLKKLTAARDRSVEDQNWVRHSSAIEEFDIW